MFAPQKHLDLNNLEQIILVMLKSYIDKCYTYKLRQTETKQLQLSFMVKKMTIFLERSVN